jgi:hypothetical protein
MGKVEIGKVDRRNEEGWVVLFQVSAFLIFVLLIIGMGKVEIGIVDRRNEEGWVVLFQLSAFLIFVLLIIVVMMAMSSLASVSMERDSWAETSHSSRRSSSQSAVSSAS